MLIQWLNMTIHLSPRQFLLKRLRLLNPREKGGNVIAIESLPEKKDIQLNWISSEDFFKLYKSINLEEGYGGFVSFKNLYFSIDGKKAYFEFTYFRRKMSSSTSVVYAEKQDDGSWIFSTELVSMS